MKKVKLLLVFVFFLVGTLTVLAFASGKYHKAPMFTECLKYTGPRPSNPFDLIDPGNWTSTFETPYISCRGGWDICIICFDNFNTTPQQAREILFDYCLDHGFPGHGQSIFTFDGKSVTVYLKAVQ